MADTPAPAPDPLDSFLGGAGPLDKAPGASGTSGASPPTDSLDSFLGGPGPLDTKSTTAALPPAPSETSPPSPSSGPLSAFDAGTTVDSARMHSAKYLGQEALQGLLRFPSSVRTVADDVSHVLGLLNPARLVGASVGHPVAEAPQGKDDSVLPFVPSMEATNKFIEDRGLNSVKPSGPVEKYAGAAAEGLGNALPTLGIGAEPLAARLAINAGSALASGIGAEVGKVLSPNSSWGPILGAMATGLGAQSAGKFLSTAAEARSATAALASANERLAAAKAAQAEVETAATATKQTKQDLSLSHGAATDQGQQALAQVQDTQRDLVERTIAAHSALRDQALEQSAQAQKASQEQLNADLARIERNQRTAGTRAANKNLRSQAEADYALQDLGEARTTETDPDKIGEIVQGQGRKFLSEVLPTEEDRVWDPVNSQMKGKDVPLDSFTSRVEKLSDRGGSLSDTVAKLVPNVAKFLGPTLKKFLPEETEPSFTEGLGLPPGISLAPPPPVPTWEDVRQLRSALGEAKANPEVIKKIGAQNLDSLYQAVTEDLSSAADAEGLGTEFAKANATSSSLRKLAEGPVSALISGPKEDFRFDPAPGKLVNGLLNEAKDSGRTLSLLRGHPGTSPLVDVLAGHVLNRLPGEPELWDKLSPGAKVALVPSEAERTAIGEALGTKAQSPAAVNVARYDAKRQLAQAGHEGRVDQARALADQANEAYRTTVESTRASAAAALRAQQRANAQAAWDRRAQAREATKSANESASAAEAAKGQANAISEEAQSAQARLDALRSGETDKTGKSILHGVQALLASHLGEGAVDAIAHGLSLLDPEGRFGAAGKLGAAAVPSAVRGVGNALAHPILTGKKLYRGALIGASASGPDGENELSSPSTKR